VKRIGLQREEKKKEEIRKKFPRHARCQSLKAAGSATLKISVKATALVSEIGYRARTRNAFSNAAWAAPFENVTRPFDIVQRYSIRLAKFKFSEIATMKRIAYNRR